MYLLHFSGLNEAGHPEFLISVIAFKNGISRYYFEQELSKIHIGLVRNVTSKLYTTVSSWADQVPQQQKQRCKREGQEPLKGHGQQHSKALTYRQWSCPAPHSLLAQTWRQTFDLSLQVKPCPLVCFIGFAVAYLVVESLLLTFYYIGRK